MGEGIKEKIGKKGKRRSKEVGKERKFNDEEKMKTVGKKKGGKEDEDREKGVDGRRKMR